jgi:hypothetical protein
MKSARRIETGCKIRVINDIADVLMNLNQMFDISNLV